MTTPAIGAAEEDQRARFRLSALSVRLRDFLTACWRADEARRVLWTPVLLGAGIYVYFLLKTEPPFWAGPTVLLSALAAAWGAVRAGARRTGLVLLICVVLAAGFTAAQLRTAFVDAPILKRETGVVDVEGRILAIDRYGEKGGRIIIAPDSISRMSAEDIPDKVRVTWRGELGDVWAGERATIPAVLTPPPAPAAPGAFDFARQAYFQRLGAVGYSIGPPESLAAPPRNSLPVQIEALREKFSARIRAAAPGDAGAISAALVTGKREAISDEATQAFRDTGLAHLLAISGLHVGLVAGIVFLSLRSAFALLPAFALTAPIKKWAALGALAAAGGYLALSGASWSTQRAFLMAAFVFGAVLLDRRAISLRNVAAAATLLLLLFPEAVLHAGFQMSFAAAAALVAAYETARDKGWGRGDGGLGATRWLGRAALYLGGVAATTIVAEAATAPFSAAHFQKLAAYGLVANLIAMPVVAFWIMPFAVLGAVLTPLGLDALAWKAMAAGVAFVLHAAEAIASWNGAAFRTPAPHPAAVTAIVLGGAWLILWRAAWRWAGLAAICLGVLFWTARERPQLLLSDDSANAAVYMEDGRYALYSVRRNKFDAESWLRRNGEAPFLKQAATWDEAGGCDSAGCAMTSRSGLAISYLEDMRAFAEDCRRNDIVLIRQKAPDWAWRDCTALVIDRIDVWANGAYAVYGRPGALEVRTAMDARGDRPWVLSAEDKRR